MTLHYFLILLKSPNQKIQFYQLKFFFPPGNVPVTENDSQLPEALPKKRQNK